MSHKILIVEDEEHIATMYRMKFEQSGYVVDVASDGKSAFEKAKIFQPELILLDLILPEESGLDVLKRLKTEVTTQAIDVIVVSNLGHSDDVDEGKKLGAIDYIIKAEVTPAQLVERIDKVFKK